MRRRNLTRLCSAERLRFARRELDVLALRLLEAGATDNDVVLAFDAAALRISALRGHPERIEALRANPGGDWDR